ncbi:mycothiol synthase [Raineyella antarctica]|uniref:Mycothiol acetyltransferase n=1 Tax=Raineyella antarctica TaxID=1577474 RepID=A0A1G6GET1_9ACTN|nr:mycothiol synthase [Raineyella antarctica]SDB80255.1 mycothiol synthase [Raineyella antarctica]
MRYEPTFLDDPDDSHRTEILAMAGAAAAFDGVDPLNEAARMSLRPGAAGARHLVLSGPAGIEAYANLSATAEGTAIQLVVAPEARLTGIGTAMLEAALAALPPDPAPGIWSFGDLSAARGFAAANGLRPGRNLLIMEAPLTGIPAPRLPAEVTVRAFRPEDEAALLGVNARAFAHHPEQGAMDAADFRARTSEDWYRPEDLLVAERDGRLVGFHWTKRHDADLWEVYVIGVDPVAHGGGLGKGLLRAGLQHMAEQGARRVILYVEGDQEVAVGLYRAHGFRTIHTDVMYVPA